jgi:ferrous iron transport protein B
VGGFAAKEVVISALGTAYFLFYAPCFVTVVMIVRESGSWKWGAFSMAFSTTLAFVLAALVFQIGSAMGILGG